MEFLEGMFGWSRKKSAPKASKSLQKSPKVSKNRGRKKADFCAAGAEKELMAKIRKRILLRQGCGGRAGAGTPDWKVR